jgi:hypothetical protein
MKQPKDIVRHGYDQISYRYRDDAGQDLIWKNRSRGYLSLFRVALRLHSSTC